VEWRVLGEGVGGQRARVKPKIFSPIPILPSVGKKPKLPTIPLYLR
jgi:hypothetical protein